MTPVATRRRSRAFIAGVSAAVLIVVLAVGFFLVRSPGGLVSCKIGGRAAQCERFAVAENPAAPSGKKIHLNVAVFKATGVHPKPDPLMWFSGWGGAGVSDDAANVMPLLRSVNVDRDIVFIDQRGTGSSKLECALQSGPVRPQRVTAAARSCATSIGPNLRYYTSAVAVDDFDRVRKALGYDEVNIYGGSYGVTTGLIYLLRHGSHVRSAVFDSGSLLDVHIFERAAAGNQRALDMLFKRCADDTGCATAYPHLRREFDATLARLAKHPIAVKGSSQPLTSEAFASIVADTIAYNNGKAIAPRLIHLVATGRVAEAAKLVPPQQAKSELAYKLLIQCSEPWASWRADQIRRLGGASYLTSSQLTTAKVMAAVCKGFPKGVAPASIGHRVRSNLPVLFLTGNEDPADPPANVANARRELPNSRTLIFPRSGHGQLGLLCAQNLMTGFIRQASAKNLDTTCVATAVQSEFDIRP